MAQAAALSPSRSIRSTEACSLTPRQEEARRLLAGPQRHTLLVGGSRSGKTFTLCRAVLVRAAHAPSSRHAIFRLRANAARSTISLDTLPKASKLCLPGYPLTEHRQDGFFSYPNGSQIWIGGLDDKDRVEKILGMEFSTLYFNECSQIPYSSITTARTRLAQSVQTLSGRELPLRGYYDLNPTGTGHWSYQLFVAGREPDTRQPLKDSSLYRFMYLNPRDNAANLPAGYIESELESLPERQRRRFLAGEYQTEIDGALWTIEGLEACRVDDGYLPAMDRLVVAVDPSGHTGAEDSRSDQVGICVAGRALGHAFLLEDLTCSLGPEGWARVAVEAYHRHKADAIVAEINYGGDMVRAVIHSVDPNAKVRVVTASRGKAIRAEPVSALYAPDQAGDIRVHHVGDPKQWIRLEDELLNFSTAGYQGSKSPNAADAAIWALTDLMVDAIAKRQWSFG